MCRYCAGLAPLYSLVNAADLEGWITLPPFALAVLRWLADRLKQRRLVSAGRLPLQGGALFRVDAKASGSDVAIVGLGAFSMC